mmetsp:Transcript_15281/g.45632  ORF Transcript_15281/g.45632 Transcript_15281/m.45632 type:complete len:102 (+) Transcript_15281:319-624(+)
MDGWGALTMLVKRQNAAKYRKAALRHELQKRKESFLKDVYDDEKLDFPEISSYEMNVLKREIRAKLKKQKRQNLLSYAMVIGLILLFFFLLYFSAMWILKG